MNININLRKVIKNPTTNPHQENVLELVVNGNTVGDFHWTPEIHKEFDVSLVEWTSRQIHYLMEEELETWHEK